MTKRKRKMDSILNKLVEIYIETNLPVSSADLHSFFKESTSRSSIRNHLQELATKGLVFPSHNNQGKIPSDHTMQKYAESIISNDSSLKLNYKKDRLENNLDDLINYFAKKFDVTILYYVNKTPSAFINCISDIKIVNSGDGKYHAITTSRNSKEKNVFDGLVKNTWDLCAFEEICNSNNITNEENKEKKSIIWSDIINKIQKSSIGLGEAKVVNAYSLMSKFASEKKIILQFARLLDNKADISKFLCNAYEHGTHILLGKYFNVNRILLDRLSIVFNAYKSIGGPDIFLSIISSKFTKFKKNKDICKLLTSKIHEIMKINQVPQFITPETIKLKLECK